MARIQADPSPDERTAFFEAFGVTVYSSYQRRCADDHLIDFDDLIARGALRIAESGGDVVCFGKGGDARIRDLEWVVVDEFQDFSAGFNRIIAAIRASNPGVNLLCVGDDWQAINAFAGSDTRFYEQFSEFFQPAEIRDLLTNRRSSTAIVELGNKIMRGAGRPAYAASGAPKGKWSLAFLDKEWIELREGDEWQTERDQDSVFVAAAKNADLKGDRALLLARLLKCVCRELQESPSDSFLLLSRTNNWLGTDLRDFITLLARCMPPMGRDQPPLRDRVLIMTVHRAKGQEADHVIVLDAVGGRYPLLHSDEALYRIFGRSISDAIEAERRLFYVACSRARKTLLLISERGNEPDFLLVEPT